MVINDAKKADKERLVNRAHEIALGYAYEEITTVEYKDKEGNITGSKVTTVEKYAKADAGIMQFLLINRFPRSYDKDNDGFARDPQVLEIRRELLELKKQLVPPSGGLGDV